MPHLLEKTPGAVSLKAAELGTLPREEARQQRERMQSGSFLLDLKLEQFFAVTSVSLTHC